MPELPEVETIKNQLFRKLKGKTFKSVEIKLPKMVKTKVAEFKHKVKGARINSVERRAKLIIMRLSNDYAIIIHLKMTGQLIYNGPRTKHTHLIYYFTDGSHLIHNDMRQFGFVKFMSQDELEKLIKEKEKYGPEPLTKEFTLSLFKDLLKKRPKSRIKQFLMDQKAIAGIGNIYSDEILFVAKVKPERVIKTLKEGEIEEIYKAIPKILKLAIKHKGTSEQSYLDAYGKKGTFQNMMKVYQRKGKPCPRCKATISKIKMGGRSAHFCLKCQK